MQKIIDWLEKKVYPLAVFFQENKYLASIQYGIMLAIPLLLVGAFACIISDFPSTAYQDFMSNLFGADTWAGWNWDVLNPATMGLTALIAMIGTANELGKRNNVAPLPGVAICIMVFIILTPSVDGNISLNSFSARTLFLSLILAIVNVSIYTQCLKHHLTIKMPDAVPAFISEQFTALIPAIFSAILALVIRYIFAATAWGDIASFMYGVLQAPLTKVGTSFAGTMLMTLLNTVLWFFGIHGSNVVESIMDPIWYAARDANFQIYSQNALAARPYITTIDFTNMITWLTGTGITLPLVIEMLFMCKSERLKTVGKGALLPGIFNVNEPVIFGLPLVMNPVMLIPFAIVPVVVTALAYWSMALGIVPTPTGVPVPWTLPFFLGGWMMTGSWKGGMLQIVCLLVSGLIYYPFIKTLDNEYYKEEQESMASAVEGTTKK